MLFTLKPFVTSPATLQRMLSNLLSFVGHRELPVNTVAPLPPLQLEMLQCLIYKLLDIHHVKFMVEPYDLCLQQMCYEEAVKRGCIMTGKFSLLPHIPGGVVMAATTYKHLKSTETRLLIALYTAFLIFLDDAFHEDMDEVAEFNSKFITNKPNEIPNLNVFAELLRDLPKYFNTIVANIMVTSTLNLVTALSLEQEIGGMKVSPSAHSFPTFSRTMSGASECYALFAFPQTIPVSKYVQALPDMVTYINNGNDVLSFYKEECAKETCNRVSVLAQCNAITKYNILQGLADEAVSCHLRICDILSDDAESLNARQLD